MNRERNIEWVASLLAAFTTAFVASVLGAPIWAAYGFGMVGFWVLRVDDKSR